MSVFSPREPFWGGCKENKRTSVNFEGALRFGEQAQMQPKRRPLFGASSGNLLGSQNPGRFSEKRVKFWSRKIGSLKARGECGMQSWEVLRTLKDKNRNRFPPTKPTSNLPKTAFPWKKKTKKNSRSHGIRTRSCACAISLARFKDLAQARLAEFSTSRQKDSEFKLAQKRLSTVES